MEPLSITTACLSLVTTITKTSVQVVGFVKDVRAARSDLDAVSRELYSLKTILELLADDVSASSNSDSDTSSHTFPHTLQKQITGIIKNCTGVVGDIEEELRKHEGGGKMSKSAQWVAFGRGSVGKLQLSLEAHKSALEIALDMVALTMAKEIKADTMELLNDTSVIKEDTTQILAQIARLQGQLPRDVDRRQGSGYMLERYLDNLTSYAETVIDTLSHNGSESSGSEKGSIHQQRETSPDGHPETRLEIVQESGTIGEILSRNDKTRPYIERHSSSGPELLVRRRGGSVGSSFLSPARLQNLLDEAEAREFALTTAVRSLQDRIIESESQGENVMPRGSKLLAKIGDSTPGDGDEQEKHISGSTGQQASEIPLPSNSNNNYVAEIEVLSHGSSTAINEGTTNVTPPGPEDQELQRKRAISAAHDKWSKLPSHQFIASQDEQGRKEVHESVSELLKDGAAPSARSVEKQPPAKMHQEKVEERKAIIDKTLLRKPLAGLLPTNHVKYQEIVAKSGLYGEFHNGPASLSNSSALPQPPPSVPKFPALCLQCNLTRDNGEIQNQIFETGDDLDAHLWEVHLGSSALHARKHRPSSMYISAGGVSSAKLESQTSPYPGNKDFKDLTAGSPLVDVGRLLRIVAGSPSQAITSTKGLQSFPPHDRSKEWSALDKNHATLASLMRKREQIERKKKLQQDWINDLKMRIHQDRRYTRKSSWTPPTELAAQLEVAHAAFQRIPEELDPINEFIDMLGPILFPNYFKLKQQKTSGTVPTSKSAQSCRMRKLVAKMLTPTEHPKQEKKGDSVQSKRSPDHSNASDQPRLLELLPAKSTAPGECALETSSKSSSISDTIVSSYKDSADYTEGAVSSEAGFFIEPGVSEQHRIVDRSTVKTHELITETKRILRLKSSIDFMEDNGHFTCWETKTDDRTRKHSGVDFTISIPERSQDGSRTVRLSNKAKGSGSVRQMRVQQKMDQVGEALIAGGYVGGKISASSTVTSASSFA